MRIFNSVLLIVLFYGCSGIKEAQYSMKIPNCNSVVEVFYSTDTTYTTKPPHLLLKHAEYSNDTRYLYGSIVSVNDSGVIFRRSKNPKLYPYKKIECLIDSNNRIAYGNWKYGPEVIWETELICKRIDIPNSKPFSLILEANKISSYCIEPGDYEIYSIRFSYSDEYLDESDTLKFGRFTVSKNAINYIGSIYSEFKWNLSSGMTPIPTNVIRRRGMGASSVAIFGVVGGVVDALNNQKTLERERMLAPLHGLKVTIDPNYTPMFKGDLQVLRSPIIFEKAP